MWIFTARRYAKAQSLLSSGVRPSVCLSATFVCRIQTAEDIVKLLSRPGTLIILFFDPERSYPIPRGTLSSAVLNTRGGNNLRFSTEIALLSRKRYEIGPLLLWYFSRKSQVADRSVSVPMTLSDLQRRDARGHFSGGS